MIDNEWLRFSHRNPDSRLAAFFDKAQILREWRANASSRKLHIALYVHGTLHSKGGIERLAAQLSSIWLHRGHKVDLYCGAWAHEVPVYPHDPGVRIIPIFDANDLPGSVTRMRILLADDPPDVFVAMLSEWLFTPVVDAAYGLGFPVVVSEHNDPWKICENWWNTEERNRTFAKADAIHLLLRRYAASLPEQLQPRINVIPNGIQMHLPSLSVGPCKGKRIIGVGRLATQKRHDRLIEAFSSVAGDYPEWSLVIFGDGPERGALETLAAASEYSGRISLPGETSQIEAEYAASDIFVSASEFEGFPLVVLEAKRAGIPAIGFANCNGPNDLIRDGVDGLLVAPTDLGEIGDLAAALRKLMQDEELRHKMGAKTREDLAKYDIAEIGLIWERWLDTLVETRGTLDVWDQTLRQSERLPELTYAEEKPERALAGEEGPSVRKRKLRRAPQAISLNRGFRPASPLVSRR